MTSSYCDCVKGSDKERYERKLRCLFSEASKENQPLKSLDPYQLNTKALNINKRLITFGVNIDHFSRHLLNIDHFLVKIYLISRYLLNIDHFCTKTQSF